MKLYDVPRNTKVRVLDDIATPIGSPEINKGDEIMFYHLDGMYSYCTINDTVVHLVGWAEVEIV